MKKIFTLFGFIVFSMTVLAADIMPKSMLTVTSVNKEKIRVILDGKVFEPETNALIIQSIDAGYHSIKVYRQKNSGTFYNNGKKFELVYNSSIAVNGGRSLQVAIDRFGKTTITEERIERTGRHYDNGGWQNEGHYNAYVKAINDREFDRVVNAMQKEWLETNKLKSARQIISSNFFTTEQVAEMMSLFTFESNKLEVAKLAYTKTVDIKNYHLISNELKSKSSKQELARYIRDSE